MRRARRIPGYFPVHSLSDYESPVFMRVSPAFFLAGKNSLFFSLRRENGGLTGEDLNLPPCLRVRREDFCAARQPSWPERRPDRRG